MDPSLAAARHALMRRGRFSDFGGFLTGERVERRLAAVLAADVAGYSRLMGRDEEGTLARLKAVRKALVDPAIASHAGRSALPPINGHHEWDRVRPKSANCRHSAL
jgi:class 3 adenylate cyclase